MASKKKSAKGRGPATEITNIEALHPDDRNANRGTQRGMSMLEQSLRDYGAGRSVLIDKNDRIIAGNKTAEVASDVGIKKVRIVETTGDELIAVKRVDLDMDEDPRARELGVMDNRVGQVNLDWDPAILATLRDEGVDLGPGWLDHELDRIFKSVLNEEVKRTTDLAAGGGLDDEVEQATRRAASGIADDDEEAMDLASGHVRMVQLVFQTKDAHDEFENMVDELGKLFSTDTVTDTVWQSILSAEEQTREAASA